MAFKGEVPRDLLIRGEAWSDAAIDDLTALPDDRRKAWIELLLHCAEGGDKKLSDKWAKKAGALVVAVGFDELKQKLLAWLPLVDKPRTQRVERRSDWRPDANDLIIDKHVAILRGLTACAACREDAELARTIGRLALSSFRKIRLKGPRLVALGNASIGALGRMPGSAALAQLALLKVKLRLGSAQKEIAKAFRAVAEQSGLPEDEIEELAVPSYGFDAVGELRRTFGEYEARLTVDGSSVAIAWRHGAKTLKSLPAAVRAEHVEALKDLKGTQQDVAAMLPAQRQRLDAQMISSRTRPLAVWRRRIFDHLLIGAIARRLIWEFVSKDDIVAAFHADGAFVNVAGARVEIDQGSAVKLWHPIGKPVDEVLAWRRMLESRGIVQPFKQAHREVYVLTDAERRTASYSNRYAAHVLKQHPFNALASARGWRNQLRLLVDSNYPPAHRILSEWRIRAEFWVEGLGDRTNEAGVYDLLATDQVRFYAVEAPQWLAHAGGGGYRAVRGQEPAEPLPLEVIPPIVFSEIMRDVDLFVGVASVGADPTWVDGGRNEAHADYWRSYSFGELSANARSRRDVLERVVPRLKIAGLCSFVDRFLVVRGSKRTYKIHLGSGNILMEPNDQYLCIVPRQSVESRERVYLPFEGDATLSLILSKAFLLAADDKIADPTIVRQIGDA